MLRDHRPNAFERGVERPAFDGSVPSPPAFDAAARGVPRDWSEEAGHTLWWGNATRQHFQDLFSSDTAMTPPKVDVRVVIRFLEMRIGPDGLPVSTRLGRPQERQDGWTRLVWLHLTGQERTRLEKEGWERGWHGCKIESLYSILYHGKLHESCDRTQGDRFLTDAPGVYLHKDGTSRKAENYTRFTPLCGDGVFWAAKWEVLADRANHRVKTKRKTDQWVQRSDGVQLVALWLCGRTAKDMQNSVPVAKRWLPELEANPRGAIWEQRAKAALQASDMPEPGLPPRSARVVVVPSRPAGTMMPDVVVCPGRCSAEVHAFGCKGGCCLQPEHQGRCFSGRCLPPGTVWDITSDGLVRIRSDPSGASWEQRAEAELQAGDMLDSGAVTAAEYHQRYWNNRQRVTRQRCLPPAGAEGEASPSEEPTTADAAELGVTSRLRDEAERAVSQMQQRLLSDEDRAPPSRGTKRDSPSPDHSPGSSMLVGGHELSSDFLAAMQDLLWPVQFDERERPADLLGFESSLSPTVRMAPRESAASVAAFILALRQVALDRRVPNSDAPLNDDEIGLVVEFWKRKFSEQTLTRQQAEQALRNGCSKSQMRNRNLGMALITVGFNVDLHTLANAYAWATTADGDAASLLSDMAPSLFLACRFRPTEDEATEALPSAAAATGCHRSSSRKKWHHRHKSLP